jgi:hypothetical protein
LNRIDTAWAPGKYTATKHSNCFRVTKELWVAEVGTQAPVEKRTVSVFDKVRVVDGEVRALSEERCETPTEYVTAIGIWVYVQIIETSQACRPVL